ncbi:DUF4919 domain-containing protein [Ferruginibacter albus]|uniref:DUF4919 domain-containing protein n=1 Tax=Ferruginibacter albus TaxID=2875540 RepID=UPI001CC619A7|nr:DUF4919 domain-containing protein [Ferruginibacter albus]UAY53370.1 DUF4919 domain-containing protein [Ferruginibacter albus]
MKNLKPLLLVIILHTTATLSFGQDIKIKVPTFDDKYSKYVKQLENGDLAIDYTDFRHSFLESKQFSQKGTAYDSLKELVYTAIKSKNYRDVINETRSMLSIDYTSMFAHKYLQQTYKILGDTINQKKYHDIEFGLLRSITRSGDGNTCETGWHVTQIEEEYFILNMLGDRLQQQSISSGGKNTCDKMDVTEDGKTKTYYFEANKVFEQERKLLEK